MLVSIGANGQFSRRLKSASSSAKVTGKVGSSASLYSRKKYNGGAVAGGRQQKGVSILTEAAKQRVAATTASRSERKKDTSRSLSLSSSSSSSSLLSNATGRYQSLSNSGETSKRSAREIIREVATTVRQSRCLGLDRTSDNQRSLGGTTLKQIKSKYQLAIPNIKLETLVGPRRSCRLEDIIRGKVAVIDFWVGKGQSRLVCPLSRNHYLCSFSLSLSFIILQNTPGAGRLDH